MIKKEYNVSFNVPAFMGDAEQKSVWRTPPFKALIQHWWRIVVAKDYAYDWQRIREAEGRMFGHAWLDDNKGQAWGMRSQVRIKLNKQEPGSLLRWIDSPSSNKITHPEVKDRNTGKLRAMLPETYLAYGPLHFRDGLSHPPAINAQEQNILTLMYPEELQKTLSQTMQFIHWFGTLGGRSRNGWGSVDLQGNGIEDFQKIAVVKSFACSLENCLQLDWSHAIGMDSTGLLIWQTPERNKWADVIKDLTEIKIKFRTTLPFSNGKPGQFEKRHLLAYPVTNHEVKVNGWRNNGRLANQVRFKVIHSDASFRGIVMHLPSTIPREMMQFLSTPPTIQDQIAIWQTVHKTLDQQLERIKG